MLTYTFLWAPSQNAAPIVFTSVMTFVFKMKVLPVAEYDSLTAELETTKQKLTDVTAIEEKEKKEAAANFEAFSQAKGQKTAAQEKIAELEAKIKVMEEHMAQAKELAASSITKMDDGLRKRDMTPGAAKEEPAAAATAPAENAEKPAAAAANKGG